MSTLVATHDLPKITLSNGDTLSSSMSTQPVSSSPTNRRNVLNVQLLEHGLVRVPTNATLDDWQGLGEALKKANPELFGRLVQVLHDHDHDCDPDNTIKAARKALALHAACATQQEVDEAAMTGEAGEAVQ